MSAFASPLCSLLKHALHGDVFHGGYFFLFLFFVLAPYLSAHLVLSTSDYDAAIHKATTKQKTNGRLTIEGAVKRTKHLSLSLEALSISGSALYLWKHLIETKGETLRQTAPLRRTSSTSTGHSRPTNSYLTKDQRV